MAIHGIRTLDERISTLSRKHISTNKDTRLEIMIPLITDLFEQIGNLRNISRISTESYEELHNIVGKWVDYLAYHGVVVKEPVLPLRDNADYLGYQVPNTKQDGRSKRKRYQGVVVRVSGAKTIAVECTTWQEHPIYGKKRKHKKTYLVHDENEMACVGDWVEIMESRPISKSKHHVVLKVLRHRPNLGTKAYPVEIV